jgi:ankyrin repeat protein
MKWLRSISFAVLLLESAQGIAQEGDTLITDRNAELILAAYQGDTIRARLLIHAGANVNATTFEGVTPLMYAAQNGFTGMVRLLKENGADVNLKPLTGYTALISAVRAGYIGTAEYLIRNGAEIDLPDHDMVTPLMHAIVVDSFYLPDMLLYYNASVGLKDTQGVDALMLASWLGRYETVISLLEAGADINAVDEQNRTPLHYATSADHREIMELLILNGASLEIRAATGHTPLSLAVALNNYPAARLLIGYGADVNSMITPSLNPLTLALENHNDSLAGMLKNHEAKAIRKPYFNLFTLGTRVLYNPDDQQLGFTLGFSDSKYNLMTGVGYGFRLTAIQVLEQSSETEYYQYWEKRNFISLSVEKAFYMPLGSESWKAGIFTGLSEVLTFGGYRGSNMNPDVRLLFNPRIGGIFQYSFLRLKFDYEFMNLHLREISRGWFNFSLEFLFRRNRGSIRTPSVNWL